MAAEIGPFESCILMNSKRNDVRHCQWAGEDVVEKCFVRREDYLREKSVYQNLLQSAPEMCPRVIDFDDRRNRLILEYISGVTVLKALERAEDENDQERGIEIFTQLLAWIQTFHESHQQVMGDINLRNFLWVDQHVIGIDFEGCCLGDPKEEVLRVIAFYLLYAPERTRYKLSVVHAVIDSILRMTDRSVLLFWETLNEEMEKIQIRRRNANKTH